MNRAKYLARILTPKFVVQHGMLTDSDLARLHSMQPGEVVQVSNANAIRLLDTRPIRIVMSPLRAAPSAAMGPTLRAHSKTKRNI